jgi:hypothetical protein
MLNAGAAIRAESDIGFEGGKGNRTFVRIDGHLSDISIFVGGQEVFQSTSHGITTGGDHLPFVPHWRLTAYTFELTNDGFQSDI